MPNWTDAQLDAIKARRGTVLVSAAAGSGKTAVDVYKRQYKDDAVANFRLQKQGGSHIRDSADCNDIQRLFGCIIHRALCEVLRRRRKHRRVLVREICFRALKRDGF